jgi:hypothetical protein
MYNIANGRDNVWGVQGYYLPKKSVLYSSVSHAVPKEKGNDFIDQSRKLAKGIPAPGKYENKVNWKTPRGKFGQNDRKTYIDFVKKKSKETPGPGAYKPIPIGFHRIQGGKIDKM